MADARGDDDKIDRPELPDQRIEDGDRSVGVAEIDRAVDALAEILTTRSWDDPRFMEKRRVT